MESFVTPTPGQRRLGFLLLVLLGAHLYTMVTHEPGLIDLAWSCNMTLVTMTALMLFRFHPSLNYTVFFWSLLGGVTWAVFLIFEPSIFRFTSLSSHTIVPALSFYYLRRTGLPRRAWLWAAVFGEISFTLLVAFHPERNYLFLFDFDAAPPLHRLAACLVIQAYYGLLVWLGYRLSRRFLG